MIEGGREPGYRAWSHKQNFPARVAGNWRIDVMTDSGQRIGVLRFTVSEEHGTLADGRIQPPPGLPGLDWRRLVPGRGSAPQREASNADAVRRSAGEDAAGSGSEEEAAGEAEAGPRDAPAPDER